METKKEYPIIDGPRKHYARTPIEFTNKMRKETGLNIKPGSFVAVDILESGYAHLSAPIAFKYYDECLKVCNTHNEFYGFSVSEVEKLKDKSTRERLQVKACQSLVALFIFVCSVISAQSPCDTIFPPLAYSTGCHTFCTTGSYNLNASTCGWIRVSGQYCDSASYVFTINGGAPTQTPSIIFTPGAPGITNFTLTGSRLFEGVLCQQSIAWSFTTVVCSIINITGIEELQLTDQIPLYFDLQGLPIKRRLNELIIQQVGNTRRKIIIQN